MIASTEATSSDESGRSREGPRALAFETTMEELAAYMRGWCGYFGFSETPEVLVALTRWVRWRPRAALWRQWKTALSLLGFQMHTSNRSACCPCSNGVSATSRAAVYGPARTVVWEGRNREAPPIPIAAPLCIGPSRRYWQAALKSPYEGRADVICWPRALRLVT